MFRELQAVVMPGGTVQLEWTDTSGQTGKSRHLLEQEIERRFSGDDGAAFLFLGFSDASLALSPSLEFFRGFSSLFIEKLSKIPDLEALRHRVTVELGEDELGVILAGAPLMSGEEYLTGESLRNIWRGLNAAFRREIRQYDGTVGDFFTTYSPRVHLAGRVYFHLVESRKEEYPFAFLATYSTGLDKGGRSKHLPLKYALQEYGNDSAKMLELLATVHLAAKESPLIAGLLESGELFHPLAWSSRDAYTFLKEIPLYEKSGILCRIPDWWKRGTTADALKLRITVGDTQPSYAGMDALLSFDPRLFLGDTPVSPEEARRLLLSSEGLVLIKNRWVAADPDTLRQTLAAYEKAQEMAKAGGLSLRDALRLELSPGAALHIPDESEGVEITNGQWLDSVLRNLRAPDRVASVKPGRDFRAELRPYQQKGVSWLSLLHSLRLGMCLADDMGLGKTLQILALLHILKGRGAKQASLLVLPASLLANWSSEIERFAPDMAFFVAHPGMRPEGKVAPRDDGEIDRYDLVITTYALIQKYEWLQRHTWNYVILDEAQAIKNPSTKQARTVKKLSAGNRIVVTGTPVENRLSDVWSLFDFINPGLLGTAQEFSRFSKGLAKESGGYARLRKIISPFILRRMKTDKEVIADLPEKVEMKTYATLSRKQTLLYRELVRELEETVRSAEGIQRKGIILSALSKTKQLCNHPDHYLGTGDFGEDDSGKFQRLREVCETIHEKHERVLVFTQFREMTGPLAHFLENVFGKGGLVLHGGTPVGKRREIVERFQGGDYVPFMVLSLKAGGVGLNLTAANHVIHFDRWWNPAVENQATDRAFRIGQKKNVIVHKFITGGTIEEKIDLMIEGKAKLSEEVIRGGGEEWITEMSNEELIGLFRLGL
ncbi:MAG: DEAD/DEAH box helicase [Alphaproteobacteria bacterium]|uniref:DEAD/DEAH box helicase n=1 Tax=Candidatus Nitrobium versatile TaxID=2884831 RepID=A0A953JG23_9BACT|nr:DEAD/DEAH box helicase [Candidatus Nitrobium versatile]